MSKHETGNKDPDAQLGEAGIDQSVEKIRDIIFGGQMRDYSRRFEALERRIAAESERLARDVENRLENLEAFVRKEFDMLSERLGQEKAERLRDRDAGKSQLDTLRGQAEMQFDELGERLSAEARTLRSDFHDQTVDLTSAMQRDREQLEAKLDGEARELEDRKVAREDLAALFTELALRLKREFDLPDGS